MIIDEAQAFPDGCYPNERTQSGSQERMITMIEHVRKLDVKLLLFEVGDGYLGQQISNYFHQYI